MRDSFIKYFDDLSRTLPINDIVGLSIVLCLLAVVVLVFFGRRKGLKWSATFLLIEYLIWVIFLVLLFRSTMSERKHILTPFWSYHNFLEGNGTLNPQVILNVLVFIPVGVLLGCAFERMRWWKATLIGAGLSIVIEVLQFVTRRGFAEFDDVFHNTLGCLFGFMLYASFAALSRSLSKRSGS